MRILAALALLFFSIPATAENNDKALACAAIDDSLRRLTCFDLLFPRDATKPDAVTPDNSDTAAVAWQFEEDRSPIDDSIRISAGLLPKKVSTTGVGNGSAFLILRCHENTTSVIISTDMFMTEDTVSVTTRFGSEQAKTSRWERSSSYKAVGLWRGNQAIPFIKQLVTTNKLVVRITERNRIDAEFELGNVKEAAEKIAAACIWKLQ